MVVTIYERLGYRESPHADLELAAVGVTDFAWEDTRPIAWVGVAGQFERGRDEESQAVSWNHSFQPFPTIPFNRYDSIALPTV